MVWYVCPYCANEVTRAGQCSHCNNTGEYIEVNNEEDLERVKRQVSED